MEPKDLVTPLIGYGVNKMKLGYVLVAISSLLFSAPAYAATVQVIGTVQNGDDFTNTIPDLFSVAGDTALVDVTGDLAGSYKDVFTGTDLAGLEPFNSVKRNGGTMTYILAAGVKNFRMIWGSVDALNILTLNLLGGGTEEVTGANVLANPDVDVNAGQTNVVVQIASLFAIESVTLTSGVNSFEHVFNPPEVPVAAVPLPAAGLLLLTAMGGIGFVASRRKSA
jgi:hypothetical protein